MDGQFRFFTWDTESIFIVLDANIVRLNNSFSPPRLLNRLRENEEFQLLFADHVQRHLFNDGVLTPESVVERWNRRSDKVFDALVAESARWGDYRRDVDPNQAPHQLYLRDDQWAAERDRLLNEYFPARTGILVDQYREVGLYPSTSAPLYNQHGGEVDLGFQLDMTHQNETGSVYFTVDGSDPRLPGGAVSSTATEYRDAVTIASNMAVKSRVLTSDGLWSALNEAVFIVDAPAEAANLAITEINYHPHAPSEAEKLAIPQFDDDDFEFIELQNTSDKRINVSGVGITDAIEFQFTEESVLVEPGESVVIVKDDTAFRTRYGNNPRVVGEFTSGRLSNGGERIQLSTAIGTTILDFVYDDTDGWPTEADGKGPTLEILNPLSNYNNPASWRASPLAGGTPGKASESPAAPGDSNGDDRFDQIDIEHVLQIGKYLSHETATFEQGDWNGDGRFDTLDIVFALQSNNFEGG